jgi:4-amino-4-deoxy-L-arabinose transferase-like glycosyltransferase
MPAREMKRKPAKTAPTPAAKFVPGFWELRAAPLLNRWAPIILILLILAGAARIVSTYKLLSMTFDEPIHYTCGLEYLTDHAYRLETQHPPMERAMGALIPYLMGERSTPETRLAPKVPARYDAALLSHREVLAKFPPDPNADVLLARIRWGVLPFFILAVLVVYEWTRYIFDKATAVLAAALFTLIPPVLAHAGLATTDIALTACLGAAFLSLLRWAESPNFKRGLVAGFWTGLSVLSKFTTLIYLPAATVLALAAFVAIHRPGTSALIDLAKRRLPSFAAAVAFGAFLIWAGYWFSIGTMPGWSLRLPAPEFFDGIRSVIEHNKTGHRSFLLGENSRSGWWYFFPVVLSVKTPLSILVLLVVGLWVCIRRRFRASYTSLAFALGVLLPAMMGRINIGVRHVLPIYISFAILGAAGLIALTRISRAWWFALLAPTALLVWLAVPGIRQHPDYLAYFNELAGEHPELILADSDLDWGQDLKMAAKRLKEVGAKEAATYLFGEFAQPEYIQKTYGFPPLKPFVIQRPKEGWNIVSPTAVAIFGGGWHRGRPLLHYEGLLSALDTPWYELVDPTEKVGTLYFYHIPPGFVMR